MLTQMSDCWMAFQAEATYRQVQNLMANPAVAQHMLLSQQQMADPAYR
jgi:hypothetical protein